MMSNVSVLDSYPEISFIDNMTLEDCMEQMKAWYQERYEEITGEAVSLHDADKEKLRLDVISMMYYQTLVYLDFMAKQNLLKYSTKTFLDNEAARCGIARKAATPATVMITFVLSAIRKDVYTIPQGTRCTSGDDVFFSTKDVAEIPAGELSVDVLCECTESGEDGNEYEIGEINTLVDALPYIQEVYNANSPSGGADEETDDDLAERIYLAPSTYSTTGCEDSYVFWTKNASNLIGDVSVYSPEPCCVTIVFVTKSGEIPDEELISLVKAYLDDKSRKTLGDRVTVQAPDVVTFDIDVSYYVGESDRKDVSAIQSKVESAIEKYKNWQTEKLGRDINPSMLYHLIMEAGAKRAEIRNPVFQKVGVTEISQSGETTLTYGGIEDD
jgi:phage-related baseplate assembly protein